MAAPHASGPPVAHARFRSRSGGRRYRRLLPPAAGLCVPAVPGGSRTAERRCRPGTPRLGWALPARAGRSGDSGAARAGPPQHYGDAAVPRFLRGVPPLPPGRPRFVVRGPAAGGELPPRPAPAAQAVTAERRFAATRAGPPPQPRTKGCLSSSSGSTRHPKRDAGGNSRFGSGLGFSAGSARPAPCDRQPRGPAARVRGSPSPAPCAPRARGHTPPLRPPCGRGGGAQARSGRPEA